jgi:hypothetical protein
MNNIFLIFLTLIISGMEPFLGSLSLALVWAAVLGIKKHDIPGALLVFYSGLIRDVLLVNRLGQSSIIFLIIWAAAVVIGSKLSKNLFSVTAPVLGGSLILSLIESGRVNIWGMLISGIISILIVEIWTLKDSGQSGIKVRLSS